MTPPATPRRRRARAAFLPALTAALACASVAASGAAPAAASPAAAPGVAVPASVAPRADFAGEPQLVSIPVRAEAGGAPTSLDAAIYSPGDGGRHPAVIIAHGFGGSRHDGDHAARDLAGRGYVALTYTARGFGDSGGLIHLMDPDFEAADIGRLIDALAARDDVRLDGPQDPRVGITGGSYGGAAALMGAGTDRRVDAIVAGITWHDLADAFFPSDVAGEVPTPADVRPQQDGAGVFKRRWASAFMGSGLTGDAGAAGAPGTAGAAGGAQAAAPAACGRFEPTLCARFLATAQGNRPDAELLTMLRRHGPSATNDALRAPTLLVQGMNDSLFGLDHADANARQIAATGTPAAVRWFEGGHDGGEEPDPASTYLPWFETYLRGEGTPDELRTRPLPVPAFSYSAPAYRRGGPTRDLSAGAYPGLRGAAPPTEVGLPLSGPETMAVLVSPPGGDPAATTAVPGIDGTAADAMAGAAYRLAALPGQSVAFDTQTLQDQHTVVGAPTVRLSVTSSASDATLFVSLWKVSSGSATLARRQVAPVRVATRPGVPTEVDVALPAGTYAMDRGTTWRVLVSASDVTFATPTDARTYVVHLADAQLRLPLLADAVEPAPSRDTETTALLAVLAALLVALGLGAYVVRRRDRSDRRRHARDDLADVPLSVSHLVKTYADGHRAVDDVSWEAHRGQVVGLLGPNGAGKTTTIRMIVGLISPDSGDVHVHGQAVHAGSPALAGIGALIEGPGFLPHLSGRANLEAYWAATGRPREEARIEEALEVAALGGAVERPVKSYSQGMRQRLGIAQAMLGMPEVLLLDEPTNGLDPPQIAAMRPVLRRYAETGRTVVVSSHLLAEVEMTCSHVVVMHRGRVVLQGAVDDLVESSETTIVELAGTPEDAEAVAERLRSAGELPGLQEVGVGSAGDHPTLLVRASDPRPDVVAALLGAGARVQSISGRRHLEEVFLGVIAADDLDGARQVRPR